MLQTIKSRLGERHQIECRATCKAVCRTSTGLYCLPVVLEDLSGLITAYFISGREIPAPRLKATQQVSVTLRLEQLESASFMRILRLKAINGGLSAPVRSIPASWCPQPDLLSVLQRVMETLSYTPLIQFTEDFFNCDELVRPFVRIPGSVDCHHAQAAGLLAHSLDCARRVWGFLATDDPVEREAAVVAALLHDIGKIRTLTAEGRYQRSAMLMDHRAFTLEIMSPFLVSLDRTDPDMSDLLRYVWSWSHTENRRDPLASIAIAVQAADVYSAKKDAEHRAFADKASWQQRATYLNHGPVRHFWRRRPVHASKRQMHIGEGRG